MRDHTFILTWPQLRIQLAAFSHIESMLQANSVFLDFFLAEAVTFR